MDDRTQKDLRIIGHLLLAASELVNLRENPYLNADLIDLREQITTAHRHATAMIDIWGDGEPQEQTK